MRIAFVTQWFPPEPGTVVASAIADGLASRGHMVDVLTGFPNYPDGRLHRDYPLRPYRNERRSDRVMVHRAPLYPSHDSSSIKRMLNYVSYGAGASVVARWKLQRPDVWLTYSSPATSALPALSAPSRLRAPNFLLIQDLWPDSVTQSGFVTGRARATTHHCLHAFCNWSYRRAAGIGVISPSMRSVLASRGVPESKIYYTPNWVDDSHLLPDLKPSVARRADLGLPHGFLFMYAGNMGELQGLPPLVKAFARVPQVNLVLIGGGVARPNLEALVQRESIKNVHFRDAVPTDSVGAYIAASDVQVVSLRDTALLRATMPSKVQGSMASARAILAHAAGDVAELIESSGAGFATRPGDIESAAQTITRMASLPSEALQEMGHRGRSIYESEFSPLAGLDRLESMLSTAFQKRRDAR